MISPPTWSTNCEDMNVDTELNWVGPSLMLNVLLLWLRLKMGLMNHVVLISFLFKSRVKHG